jgi:hypothetical protein
VANTVTTGAASVDGPFSGILLEGGFRNHIRDNVITKGKFDHIRIAANTLYTIIGAGNAYDSMPIGIISDEGTGTSGIGKNVSLESGWVEYDTSSKPTYIKTEDGIVHVCGAIKGGQTKSGTVLFTLPKGFRPVANQIFGVSSFNGSTWGTGTALVNKNGEVQILAGYNRSFSLSGIAFLGT